MIASHDTYTYQKPKNIFMCLIPFWWKCQKKTDIEQYKLGTRIFDVRLYRTKNNTWGTSHGLAQFKKDFLHVWDICEYFNKEMPGSHIRIILEDNAIKNPNIFAVFIEEAKITFDNYKEMIWEIGTHHPWKIYYRGTCNWKIVEHYCHLFKWDTDKPFLYNIKHIDWSSFSLPYFSKKHNPVITQEMIDDPNIMHIMDYIGVFPEINAN